MYTEKMIKFIHDRRQEGLMWAEVAYEFNKEFGSDKSAEAVRNAYRAHKVSLDIGHDSVDIKLLQHNRSVRVTNTKLRKETNIALDALNIRSDITDELKAAIKTWPANITIEIDTPKKVKRGKKCVLELLISDTHFGAQTDVFNFEVAKKRIAETRNVFIHEVNKAAATYKVDKLVIALLGDIIASFEFHGVQSAVTAEAVTPIQVVKAIEMLFFDLILPVANLGHKIVIPAVCGNHDRTAKDKPMNVPGQESITWIIYKTLEILCNTSNLKNVTFEIPECSFCAIPILGHDVLYEHGDKGMRLDRKSAESKINDRQTQMKKLFTFFRFGHFHEYVCFGRGRSISNASLMGRDGYATELGFDSDAGQVINFYLETSSRSTPFYWSYLIALDHVK